MLCSAVFQLGWKRGRVQKKLGTSVRTTKIQAQFSARMTKSGTFTRERPKFGHNSARERNEAWAQFCGRSMKTWEQICKHFTSIFTAAV